MRTLCILAAGSGQRWGGYAKEFVPIGSNRWFIDHSVDLARFIRADRIVVVTSTEKIGLYARHFQKPQYVDLHITYVVPPENTEMWDSLKAYLPHATEESALCMADTTFTFTGTSVVDSLFSKTLTFGVFDAHDAERGRFSCLSGTEFITKPSKEARKKLQNPAKAWGFVAFNQDCAMYWQKMQQVDHFDTAFNKAVALYGLHVVEMQNYIDIENFAAYKAYLQKES